MVARHLALLALCGLALGSPTPEDIAKTTPSPDEPVQLKARQTTTIAANTTAANTPVNTILVKPTPDVGTTLGGPLGAYYNGAAFLPKWLNEDLAPQLPQNQTNGKSILGTLRAPQLPDFLSGNGEPLPQGKPWGSRTALNTDPYTNPPDTGITRNYVFNVTKQDIWPDGVYKQAIVVNGAFPGPTLEANWGDYFEIVVNNMMDEGTSLHWHGLLQKATPWMDGVPSVQQCPIAPGTSFTYRFKADLYGTSWWHSHFSAQYAGGIFGPMIIYGPHDNALYDVDLGPVMISDWFHDSYHDLVDQVMAPISAGLPPPLSNNNLINGKMNYPCEKLNTTTDCVPNAGVAKFSFTTGKIYRLRLINAGAEGMQKFSIDNHIMTVIANDFVPVVPYQSSVITLGIGQRTDIIVQATGKATDAVWMRSDLGINAFIGGCTLNDGISPLAVAAIYYQNANTSAVPTSVSKVSSAAIETCANDNLTQSIPYFAIAPPSAPAVTKQINITFQSNGTNDLFFMNNSSFRADFNDPVLLESKLGNDVFAPERNVINLGAASSVRIVLHNYAFTSAHPMHLHGHNMYVLAEGYGATWDGKVTRPLNPQRRDVHLLHNAQADGTPGYMVLQFDADNPGAWPLHCHIAWHVSAGLYVNLLERPADIQNLNIPATSAQTCRDWAAWTGNNVVDVIDSGL